MQHPKKVQERKHPHKRKIMLILLCLFTAAALALVLLLPAIKQRFPAKQFREPYLAQTDVTLEEGNVSELSSITISHPAGDCFTLRMQNGKLMLDRDGKLLDLSDTYADDLLQAATLITAVDTVAAHEAEVAEHLDDMGFEPPLATVRVCYTDGRVNTLELGSGVPETSHSYYRWSGDDGIYMCDKGVADAFLLTANRLLPVAQPTFEQTLIDRVTLYTQKSTALDLRFTTDSAGFISGTLLAPYTYPMSADAVQSVLGTFQNFRLGTREAEVTDENRAQYGFDQPLCVVEVHQNSGSHSVTDAQGQLMAELLDEQSIRFTIGREEGDFFYTCEYEGNCYLMSRFLVSSLLSASASKLITKNPADLGNVPLSNLTVQTGTGVLDIRITRTERVLPNNQLETDEQGNIIFDTAFTLSNGESMTQEQFDALIARLDAMTVSGELAPEWTAGGASPRWQIILTTVGGTTRTLSAYAVDAFSDALVVDGVAKHYVYIEALEMALAEWMPKLS
ncbi:MAG: DUF4340 domain-containing protein [Clostridia bacterium]